MSSVVEVASHITLHLLARLSKHQSEGYLQSVTAAERADAMKNDALRVAALLSVVCMVAACSREPGEPSRAEQAFEELQRFVEEARDRTPEDPVEWAKEDLEKYGDWEYRVITLVEPGADALEDELNELGQERWEVFWVERTGQGLNLFLKRPAVSYLRAVPFSELGRVIPGEGSN